MTPTLTTDRLVLRPPTFADAQAIADALDNLDVTTWLTNVPYPYAVSDAEDYISSVAQEPGHHFWAIDAGFGLIGAISNLNELGYWLNAAHHGHGYMTEAARAVVENHFAQTDDDLMSGYHLGNTASANVLTKLGFENTQVVTQIKVATGKPVQTQRMVLTKANWTGA